MLDIFILAMIAGFILKKLFDTLGRVDDEEDSNTKKSSEDFLSNFNERPTSDDEINIVSAYEASLPTHIRETFDNARLIKPDFEAETFIVGAKRAFEIIIKAFADGDKELLRHLLSASVLAVFVKEIERRKQANELHYTTIVSTKVCEITNAELNANVLTITMHFVTEQINLVKNPLGNIIIGDPTQIEVADDLWVFQKHLKTNSEIWELIETKSQDV